MQPIKRWDYAGEGLVEHELPPAPWELVDHWVQDARARQDDKGDVPEPDAISVATVGGDGQPHVRTVLMRYLAQDGPGFYTNFGSRKGLDLEQNPRIAAALTWPPMYRAIRFTGVAQRLSTQIVTDYFRSRPYGSRIGAWASHQSQPVTTRAQLEAAVASYEEKWPDTGSVEDVPLPDFWGGYVVRCDEVEFWAGRSSRLHDRLVYVRTGDGDLAEPGSWRVERRQP
ncbi:pyridoxine/pyridoxamine 5'-phosphate oxidase [Flexivirga endophytica]|uniref:Pyridoxine/pyridoxamine 5'-phosphate oxidase n=1 Tax=Flexivirga endophytica TaxID=1849103 RepID=A0A916WZ17_9MICO|nr:pyridoxamine 5'-phosphate oxidase [Flexivirga endophytica]GGB44160.1 pyridoxine/pyridoxamine 5'-phosphate oxidase [Flexivirga endophytica]GHB60051.1 pyridoxine/pyridoxamine 5'-phosphate oxidase [Flexivirga endophytica]